MVNRWNQFWNKYGLFGTILIGFSILSIGIGGYAAIQFLIKISPLFHIAQGGEPIDLTATGTTGDFIGGVTGSLWSLAGVLLFVLALRMQSKELSLQIEEMRETKEVFQLQQFEITFFNLLKVQQDIRQELYDQDRRKPFFKFRVSALHNCYNTLEQGVSMNIANMGTSAGKEVAKRRQTGMQVSPKDIAVAAYAEIFQQHHDQLGHYFRHLFNILNFIEQKEAEELSSTAPSEEQSAQIQSKYKRYANLIQAQMTTSELKLLFYNALCFGKMKRLMHKYDFLENLSLEDLLKPDHGSFYAGTFDQSGEQLPPIHFKKRGDIFFSSLSGN
ncbi:putative phage abortive infection protein [Phaeodactylibacter xiamenensis]|uniref:putative phage abortive infection protein n=1 Tax=Phaeodactylibacter xiamenensis TaxID=1524460 RepID=UPI003BAA412E